MNHAESGTIVLYATISDDIRKEYTSKDNKCHVNFWLGRKIAAKMLKYAYEQYFGLSTGDDVLEDCKKNTGKYNGKYICFVPFYDITAVAVSDDPVAIGAACSTYFDEGRFVAEHFNEKEQKIYELDNFSSETIYYIICKKKALTRRYILDLHDKDIDSTKEAFSLFKLNCSNRAYYLATTGNASYAECPLFVYSVY